MIFQEVNSLWDEHIIMTMSLSKLGLPGTRTGIVIGNEAIIRDVSAITAIVGLANNNVGQAIVEPLIESGEIVEISKKLVRPFYQTRAEKVCELIEKILPRDVPWKMHRSEGAFFIWFWFEDLPIPTLEFYQRLREKGLIVVPGEYFFFGLLPETDWKHTSECIRVSFFPADRFAGKRIEDSGRNVE